MSNQLSDRFRLWYRHERDCNEKTLTMLESVPEDRRSNPEYQWAIDRLEHLARARLNWYERLHGRPDAEPDWFPSGASLESVKTKLAEIQANWLKYLAGLNDDDLAREIEFGTFGGGGWRWTVEGILAQVNGHAWYHRGEIAWVVERLGGERVDTDFIFWSHSIGQGPFKLEAT